MGKSALLEDAVRGDGDFRVLRARGAEMETHLAFAALHQLLKPVLGCLNRLPAHHAHALRSAIGLDPSSATDPFLVAVATLGALAEAAESSPVVCLIDDAQWLDAASSQALLFVARRLDVEPVVMLFAVRSADAFDDDASFAAAGLPELRLGGLDAGGAAELLRNRTGRRVDPTVCGRLVEETEGNPLALLELSADLTPGQLSGWEALPQRLPLTHRLERLFADRIGRLPLGARRALLLAAADDTGRLRTVLLAAPAIGVPAGSLDDAERAGLVRAHDGVLTFRHPLVRSAVYSAATASERQEAHRALAAVMDSQGDADRRAWHLAAAAVEPDETVVTELDGAAARAHARGGFQAAGAALERAAELTTNPEERCRRLVSAAQNEWLAGRFARVAGLLHAARPLASEPLLRADIAQLRAWCELSVGSTSAARRLLADTAQEVAQIDPERARRLLAESAAAAWFAPEARGGVALRRLAADLGPPEDSYAQFFADTLEGYLCQLDGDLAGAFHRLTSAMLLAERMDQPELLTFAGHHAFVVGDNEAATRIAAQVVGRARATGQVIDLLFGLPRLVLADFGAGRWTAAAAGAGEAVRLAHEIGQSDLAALPTAWLCLLAALRGDSDAFWERAAEAEKLADARGLGTAEGTVRDVVRWARAVQKATTARPATAASLLGELRQPVVVDMATLDGIESAVLAGRRDEALRWLAPVEAFRAANGAAWACARAAHGHALLSTGDVAEAHFHEALSQHDRAQRPFDRARTLLAYGEFLRRGRRRGTARAPLQSALDVFEGLGATPWAERARMELRACGQTARTRDPSTLLQLTAQEVQVARFVARGLPTREVAAQMFLSPRTIDFHLRNVFTKLGITSRAELAGLPLD
jgi:DNA-binding CsgD family transcriptional regulator